MFGEEFTEIPIVQVSIDSSLDPKTNWEAGKAVAKLRCEQVLPVSLGHLGVDYFFSLTGKKAF